MAPSLFTLTAAAAAAASAAARAEAAVDAAAQAHTHTHSPPTLTQAHALLAVVVAPYPPLLNPSSSGQHLLGTLGAYRTGPGALLDLSDRRAGVPDPSELLSPLLSPTRPSAIDGSPSAERGVGGGGAFILSSRLFRKSELQLEVLW
ncbi:hypothetical protein T492DRAFT_840186 [Pavlovales sp. CCMP2436]|nr:hypothetical protein T492DRAFT_840186 [Pavlovales sp. CCMP2436]